MQKIAADEELKEKIKAKQMEIDDLKKQTLAVVEQTKPYTAYKEE